VIVFVILSSVFFGLGVLLLNHLDVQGVIGGLLLLVFSILTLFYTTKKFFNFLHVDHNRLIHIKQSKKEVYSIKDIKKIHLNSIIGTGVMKVDFHSQKSLFLDERVYVDLWKVKKQLEKKIRSRDRKSKLYKNPKDRTITGTVLNPISLYCVIIVSIALLMFLGNNNLTAKLFGIGLILLFCFLGFSLFYFSIKENKLIVRNHIFFWYTKEYVLNNLLELRKEIHNSDITSEKLTVTTKDYKTKRYLAVSYKNKHWEEFFRDLIK